MKKYFLIAVCALLLFVVTGCGNKNQVVCTQTKTQSGNTMTGEIVADLDESDKISGITMTLDYGDKELGAQMCDFYKENAEEGDEITCSGSKITFKGEASVGEDDDVIGMAKADFITEVEKAGYTCK